jgi:phosphoribosyl 1,2-cyclic phosphodiesterase
MKGQNLEFCSIASGSSGNSYMIRSGQTTIVVDVGISGKRIKEGLRNAGDDPENVEGILLTHEHSDHIKSVRIMQKNCPFAKVYCSLGTWEHIRKDVDPERQISVSAGESFMIHDIRVSPFELSHDASAPISYTFEKEGSKIAIVTDTGCVTQDIQEQIAGSDLLVLESNHDEGVLMMGSYPYDVKRRIRSDLGHLSNDAAAECLCSFLRDKLAGETKGRIPKILLAHLSRENNSPEMAMLTVENALEAAGIYEECGILREELLIDVLSRSRNSRVYSV